MFIKNRCLIILIIFPFLKLYKFGGTWVAQLVKRPTQDFGSGHDLIVHEFEPHIRLCADSMEPAWNSFSPPSLHPPLVQAHSFSQHKLKKKKLYMF